MVVAWTPTVAAIDVDSLTHTLSNEKFWSICKIRNVENVYWAASGIVANPDLNFSLDDIAASTLSGAGALDEKLARFEATFTPKLAEAAHDIRSDDSRWSRMRKPYSATLP